MTVKKKKKKKKNLNNKKQQKQKWKKIKKKKKKCTQYTTTTTKMKTNEIKTINCIKRNINSFKINYLLNLNDDNNNS